MCYLYLKMPAVVFLNTKCLEESMKKILGFIIAFMIILSSIAYAGGGQNTGDKAQGSAGSQGDGTVQQSRGPN